MELHREYSRTKAIEAFASSFEKMELCDGEFVVLPDSILCFGVIEKKVNSSSLISPSENKVSGKKKTREIQCLYVGTSGVTPHLAGRTLYAFFNNDNHAHAPANAKSFQQILLERQ